MTIPSKREIIAAIGLLSIGLFILNTPRCTEWLAERAIRCTLAQQAALLQQGGEVCVSSTQLDSLWSGSIRYLAIIPNQVSETSGSAFGVALSTLSPDQLLGVCTKNALWADSLFTDHHIRFLRQEGFGLAALRSNEKIGLYTIRRNDIGPGLSQISYALSLHNEF